MSVLARHARIHNNSLELISLILLRFVDSQVQLQDRRDTQCVFSINKCAFQENIQPVTLQTFRAVSNVCRVHKKAN